MNTNSVVLAPRGLFSYATPPGLPVCGDFRIHGRCWQRAELWYCRSIWQYSFAVDSQVFKSNSLQIDATRSSFERCTQRPLAVHGSLHHRGTKNPRIGLTNRSYRLQENGLGH